MGFLDLLVEPRLWIVERPHSTIRFVRSARPSEQAAMIHTGDHKLMSCRRVVQRAVRVPSYGKIVFWRGDTRVF